MGNCSVLGKRCLRMGPTRRWFKPKRLKATNSYQGSHEGIKIVGVEDCNFTAKSVLCMCLVTWNMNGKVRYEDLVELVSKEDREDRSIRRGFARSSEKRRQIATDSSRRNSQVDKHGVGGFGGLIGRKKGAVAISIDFKEIRMMFVSCHLSAHEHKVEERNSQYQHISRSLFSKNRNPYSRTSQIIVWLGDLNYRLQGIDTAPARDLIHNNLQRLLTRKDQLLKESKRGQVFSGYCEGTLTFKPTYKYNVGSCNYDTSYKVRVPSWTDRILFKIEEFGEVDATLHRYESIDYIDSSDHKPVRAHLCLKVKKIKGISLPPCKKVG